MNDCPLDWYKTGLKESLLHHAACVRASAHTTAHAAVAATVSVAAASAAMVAAQFHGNNSARRERGQPLAILSMTLAK